MYFYEDPGPRNQIILFPHNSKREGSTNNITGNESLTWTCPSDINDEVLMRVYVWGGGGAGGNQSSSGNGYGGGGGGLAISEFTPVAGQAYTVTIGACSTTYNGRGGTSSFAGSGITTVSATGGNSGYNNNNPSGNPNSTGETSNPQQNNYGQGGVGVGGNIVNRRGGRGGNGSVSSSSGYGGGGGSAPAPDGHRDGFGR